MLSRKRPCFQRLFSVLPQDLTITCPSLAIAEQMADLIDGYCRLASGTRDSIWFRGRDAALHARGSDNSLNKTSTWKSASSGIVYDLFSTTHMVHLLLLLLLLQLRYPESILLLSPPRVHISISLNLALVKS